ncbi:MAG: hypothetical protein P8J29_00355 [Rhodospirillales bacterium]|nr:hypothetical protein [Rhodospirillales bacterium]
MSLFETFLLYLDGIGIAAFFLSFVYLIRRPFQVQNVAVFFAAWAALVLFEYYFFGPYSYIHMNDEGDHFVPYYLYLIDHHLGGQFGHAIGGGHDVFNAFSPGFQLLSPEIFLFSVFPIWIAILLHKGTVVVVGFVGTYLLCRASGGADKTLAAIIAALFTVSNENLVYMTYTIGAGMAFIPLLIYVIVSRSGETIYFRHVLWVSAIAVLYLDVTHIFIPTIVALGLAAIMFERITVRVIAATLTLILAEAINWGEVMYAMHLVSPYTGRGGVFEHVTFGWTYLLDVIITGALRILEVRATWIGLGALMVLWLFKSDFRIRAALGFFGVFVTYYFFVMFPWRIIGLAEVSKLSHQYIILAIIPLSAPIIAKAACIAQSICAEKSASLRPLPQMSVFAIVLGMFVYFKGYNFANYLHHGGQSQYSTIDNLQNASWRPKEARRVITLRVRDLGPEAALAYGNYGLESYDVYLMLTPRERPYFFQQAIRKADNKSYGDVDLRTFIDWSKWINGRLVDFEKQISFPMLRLANVGYILSPVPMEADGLTAVSSPASPPLTKYRMKTDPIAYLKQRLERLFDFNDIYVYRMKDPYPQAFATQKIVTVKESVDDTALINIIEKSFDPISMPAVIRASDNSFLSSAQPDLSVEKFSQVRDGYEITVSAPQGGVLVLNTMLLPFWSAEADGKSLQIARANLIQMAISVPPGSRNVAFRYHRPTIADGFTNIVKRIFGI